MLYPNNLLVSENCIDKIPNQVTPVTLTKCFSDQQYGFYFATKWSLIGNMIGASFTD